MCYHIENTPETYRGDPMPTLKPKRTFVYSSEDAKKALEAALADRCELRGSNMSQEIEGILIEALVPSGALAERSMTRIYYGMSGVRDELANAFCDAAARDTTADEPGLRPLVELASEQSFGAFIQFEKVGSDGARPIFHLRSSWDSVGNRLDEFCKANPNGPEAASASLDAALSRAISKDLESYRDDLPAKEFFGVVLRNWNALGDYSFTYRALADVVELASDWPESAASREALKSCLWQAEEQR